MTLMNRLSIAALAWLVAGGTFAAQMPAVRVDGAWMRQPPRTAASAAVYGVVVNDSTRPVTIVGAASDATKAVEFHETSSHHHMMHMRPLETLVVPAQGRFEMKSGGTHLMLIGITRAFAVGEGVTIRLRSAEGQEIPIRVEVRPAETIE
jgi:periplasmic copper chaperone A